MLKSLFTRLATGSALLCIASILALVGYGRAVFQPGMAALQRVAAQASQEDLNPPQMIKTLLPISHRHRYLLPALVAWQAMVQSEFEWQGGMLGWHGHSVLWRLLIKVHYSDDELAGLYCALVWSGAGHGLNALAWRMFDKPLSGLTAEEAAAAVVFLKSPHRYGRRPEQWAQSRDQLLTRWRALQASDSSLP